MNPEELRQLLREANEALRAGAPKSAVFDRVFEITGGRHRNTADLARAATETPPEVGGVEAAGELAAQEATFGLSDEIMGLFGGQEARDEARARIEASEEQLGTGKALGARAVGLLPQLLAGGPIAGRFIQRGGNVLLRGGRALGVGGAAGAAEGGAFAAGEAEGGLGERAEAAGRGAVTGGLLGTLLGGAGGAAVGIGRGAKRLGQKVLPTPRGEIRRTTEALSGQLGLSPSQFRRRLDEIGAEVPGVRPTLADLDQDLRKIAQEAVSEAPFSRAEGGIVRRAIDRADDQAFSKAKRRIFEPLEERVESVPDPDLIEFIKSEELMPFTREVSQKLVGQTSRPPSFRELQSVRNKLEREIRRRGDDPAVFDEIAPLKRQLDELMEEAVPGFREANRRFRSVLQFRDAVEKTAEALQADAARPSNVVASEVEQGGLLGLLGQIVDAARDLERIERESAAPVVDILLGDDGVRLLREALPGRLRRGIERGVSATGDATPVGGGLLGGRLGAATAQPDSLFQP